MSAVGLMSRATAGDHGRELNQGGRGGLAGLAECMQKETRVKIAMPLPASP